MEMSHRGGGGAEGESLLLRGERNGAHIKPYGFTYGHVGERAETTEKSPFLHTEPVRLTPAWEGADLPSDTLNLKGKRRIVQVVAYSLPLGFLSWYMHALSNSSRVGMELAPPKDKGRLIYLTLILHGLGTLTAWNMIITAKTYFENYKLGGEGEYSANFLVYAGLASQVPNLIFSWVNVFIQVGGDLTKRIVWSLSVEVLVFVVTVVLAMVDSSQWKAGFFWITIVSIVILNAFNSIFQNSVYGVAARLPAQYTGAVVLGSNISGTLTVLLGWATESLGSPRTAAIYYFIGGMLILLACFDTYFALPLNRFYRYHEKLATRTHRHPTRAPAALSHWQVARKCWLQLFNVFFIFFVSLTIFPAVQSEVAPTTFTAGVLHDKFMLITCFLTFNLTAMIGNISASLFTWPGPRLLTVFTLARAAFIPFFLVCNYAPDKAMARTLPILVSNDWLYWAMAALLGWSSGHGSSLAMMYVGRPVPAESASTAGMMGAACLVTGLVAGITFSRACWPLVYAQFWKLLF